MGFSLKKSKWYSSSFIVLLIKPSIKLGKLISIRILFIWKISGIFSRKTLFKGVNSPSKESLSLKSLKDANFQKISHIIFMLYNVLFEII